MFIANSTADARGAAYVKGWRKPVPSAPAVRCRITSGAGVAGVSCQKSGAWRNRQSGVKRYSVVPPELFVANSTSNGPRAPLKKTLYGTVFGLAAVALSLFGAGVAPIGPMVAVEEPGNTVVVTDVMTPACAALPAHIRPKSAASATRGKCSDIIMAPAALRKLGSFLIPERLQQKASQAQQAAKNQALHATTMRSPRRGVKTGDTQCEGSRSASRREPARTGPVQRRSNRLESGLLRLGAATLHALQVEVQKAGRDK